MTKAIIKTMLFVTLTICFFGCSNCSSNQSYKQIMETDAAMESCIADGIVKIPLASEIESFFPSSEHYISYYTGKFGSPVWNSTAKISERYEIIAKLDISFNAERDKIKAYSNPKIIVIETLKSEVRPDGSKIITHGEGFDVDEETWRRFVASNGTLDLISELENKRNDAEKSNGSSHPAPEPTTPINP